MSAFLAVCAVVGIIVAGYLMVKGYKPAVVLMLAGFVLAAISIIFRSGLSPLTSDKSSGSRWFDIAGMFEEVAGSQLTSVGLIIMAAGGFSAYMNKIGATRALVKVVSAPVARINHPYVLLIFSYLLGQALFMVIPSAAGLAILLIVLLLPILKAANVTPAAAAAVIATSSALPMGPATGTTVLAAKTVGLSPVVYFVENQLIVALPTMVAVAIAHYFVQRHYDRKNDDTYTTTTMSPSEDQMEAPKFYSLFLVLPILLLIIFSPIVNHSIELSTVSAFIIVWLVAIVVELIRRRSGKAVLNDSDALFKGMGGMFSSVVSLIIAAQIFAQGLKMTGVIDLMIKGAEKLGAGMTVMAIIFTLIVGVVTFLTGSGVGAFSAFAKLAPDVSKGLGGSAPSLVTPMQFASGLFRSFSPVSGVVIAVSGGAGMSPLAVVRRTIIPMAVGIVVMTTCSLVFI